MITIIPNYTLYTVCSKLNSYLLIQISMTKITSDILLHVPAVIKTDNFEID